MRSKNKGWRLDYFIVSPSLLPLVKSIDIRVKETASDHVPLVMTFEEPCLGDGGKEPSGPVPAKKKQKTTVCVFHKCGREFILCKCFMCVLKCLFVCLFLGGYSTN